jgi:hypothetical protein
MANDDHMDNPDRCTATASSTGERCKQPAIPGGNVCRFHGGSAQQVKDKAQERLDRMADETTAEMQDVIQDLVDLYNSAPPEEKIDIARELRQNWKLMLDRTGKGPTESREVEHSGEGGGALEVVVARDTRVDTDGDG